MRISAFALAVLLPAAAAAQVTNPGMSRNGANATAPALAAIAAVATGCGDVNKVVTGIGTCETPAATGAMLTNASNAVLPDAWDNLKQSNYSRSISATPSPLGNWDSVATACSGNLSGTSLASCLSITGASTLTQPTSGYVYVEEAYPFPSYLYNSSGWNNSTSTNTGRTAAVAYRTHVYQHGQGDAFAYNCTGFVDTTRGSSTSFLANPAVGCLNGDLTAGVAGAYLNWGEASLGDGGFDAAGVGWVVNLNRSVHTGAKNAFWGGYRVDSIGSAPADVAYGGTGKFDLGYDCAEYTLGANAACFAMSADQRIYFDATVDATGIGRYPAALGSTYLQYQSSLSALNFVVQNASTFQMYPFQVVAVVPLIANSSINAQAGVLDNGTAPTGAADSGYVRAASPLLTTPKLAGYAVVSLPAGTIGMLAYVTDQITACPVPGVAPTAGGVFKCPVFYNGSAWVGM